jgi:hypothetical protein
MLRHPAAVRQILRGSHLTDRVAFYEVAIPMPLFGALRGIADVSSPSASLVRQIWAFNIFFATSYSFAKSNPTLVPGEICCIAT